MTLTPNIWGHHVPALRYRRRTHTLPVQRRGWHLGRGDDRSLHQDVPLASERIGVRHPGLRRQITQVTANVRQVLDTRLPDRTVPVDHLVQCGNKRAALEIRSGKPLAEDLEDSQQALRWGIPPAQRFGLHPTARPEGLATLEEGEDKVILGREVPVQSHLGDARLTDHRVDPDRAGAVAAEQVIRSSP
jgi:hypothetical protein